MAQAQIHIQISGDRQVLQVLDGIIGGLDNLRPALHFIGARMAENTKRRFESTIGPDGVRWPANSPVTLEQYLGRLSRTRRKDGELTAKGQKHLANKKPLTGETGALKGNINFQVISADTVRIGSPTEYAAVQQFGAKKGELGTGTYKTRKGTFPIPWGDIPARPFLGVADEDLADIVEVLRGHFKQA
ncbi:MAG: phage virion morphogenesis protein [Burkholderiaceae bacterium]|jgi:phage gpG-like protein|nr:phage virion morphogenesis protein [Burkholderiaceae bacterium]